MRLLLILCLALFACSSSQQINGEAYIVTAGRDAVKLTGMNVYAVPLDAVERHLADKLKADSRNAEFESFYFEGMPQEVAAATVDLDGRFSLTVPKGEYALIAMTSRKVFDKTEFYFWVVKASPQITLSNNNLNGAGDSLLPRRFSLP